jgi:hypothetical protein
LLKTRKAVDDNAAEIAASNRPNKAINLDVVLADPGALEVLAEVVSVAVVVDPGA